MAPKGRTETQNFTSEEVACMVAAMTAGGITLGAKHYNLMAKLSDGKRTSSSYEHQFRAIKSRAKELATDLGNESPAPKTPKSITKTTTSTGKKRTKKNLEDDEENGIPQTPSKKSKVKKETSEDPSDHGGDGHGINGGHFENAVGPE